MERSETIGKLSEALAKAQGDMKPAGFDATNPHFRSKYATLASIMESCRTALSQNQIAIVQGTSVVEDRVIVTTMLIHASGEFISDQLSMNIIKDSPQAIGSAITYAQAQKHHKRAEFKFLHHKTSCGFAMSNTVPEVSEKNSLHQFWSIHLWR